MACMHHLRGIRQLRCWRACDDAALATPQAEEAAEAAKVEERAAAEEQLRAAAEETADLRAKARAQHWPVLELLFTRSMRLLA